MLSESTRPERLRAACNSCHAAKTKCSGCKTGCDRCRSLGLPCKYEISMVGKVSGIRRKRKMSQATDGDSIQCATCTESVASTTAPTTRMPTPVPATPWNMTTHLPNGTDIAPSVTGSALLSPWDLTTMETPTGAPLPMMIDPELEQWFDTGLESLEAMGEFSDMQIDQLAPGHQSFVSPGEIQAPTLASILTDSHATTFTDGETSNEVKNISACSLILTTLITMLNTKAHTLDVVLNECRDQVLRLSAMIKDDEFEQWIGCRSLVSAALNLIICLFEQSILLEEEEGLSSSSSSSSCSGSSGNSGTRAFRFRYGLPRVSIGSLQYDEADQFSLCTYLMGEELTRTLSLLTQLRKTCAGRASPGATTTAKVQEVWCEEFRSRLQSLLSMLPGR